MRADTGNVKKDTVSKTQPKLPSVKKQKLKKTINCLAPSLM